MPLIVPDYPTSGGPNPATYDAQSAPSSLDFETLGNALDAVGVIFGCAVTPGTVTYSTTTTAAYTSGGTNADVTISVTAVATALPQGTPLVIAGATATPVALTAAAAASATSLDVQQPDGANPATFASGATVAVPALYVLVSGGLCQGAGGQGVYGSVWAGAVGGTGQKGLVCGVPLANADPTNPRIDSIVLRAASGLSKRCFPTVVTGTAAATPVPAPLVSGDILIAEVYVPAGVTAITAAMLTDKRGIVPTPIIAAYPNTADTATVTTTSTTPVHVMDYFSTFTMSITLVAPPSGAVKVVCSAEGVSVSGSTGATQYWQISNTTAGYPGTAIGPKIAITESSSPQSKTQDFYISGLTSGDTYTLEWQWCVDATTSTASMVLSSTGVPIITAIPLPVQP